jgi:NAD(P)-dependent dehydrogenase (short-subunit alcohol dehydrogenase family)
MAPPNVASPLTKTVRHDVYPAISPSEALAGTASGLNVFITGGGRGIGRSQALTFAKAGAAKVTIVSRSASELAEVGKEVKAVNAATEVATAVADVTSEESIRAAFDTAGEVNGTAKKNTRFLDVVLIPCSAHQQRWSD